MTPCFDISDMSNVIVGGLTHSTPDGELVAGHLVLHSRRVNSLRVLSSVKLLVQGGDLDVVGHDGTVLHRGHDEGDVHSRVVVLTWEL